MVVPSLQRDLVYHDSGDKSVQWICVFCPIERFFLNEAIQKAFYVAISV